MCWQHIVTVNNANKLWECQFYNIKLIFNFVMHNTFMFHACIDSSFTYVMHMYALNNKIVDFLKEKYLAHKLWQYFLPSFFLIFPQQVGNVGPFVISLFSPHYNSRDLPLWWDFSHAQLTFLPTLSRWPHHHAYMNYVAQ